MYSFPGLRLPCLKQKERGLLSDMKLPSVVPAEKQLSAMSGTQVCADPWREGDEDIFRERGETPGLKPWLNIAECCLLSFRLQEEGQLDFRK